MVNKLHEYLAHSASEDSNRTPTQEDAGKAFDYSYMGRGKVLSSLHALETFLTNCLYTGLTNRRCPVGNLTGHAVTQVTEHVTTQNKILPLFVDLYYWSGNILGEKQMFSLATIRNEIEL